jgi:hypothetical protein
MLPVEAVASAAPVAMSVVTTNPSLAGTYPRLDISHATPTNTSKRLPNATTVAAADRLMTRGSWRPGRNGSSIALGRRTIQSAMRINGTVRVGGLSSISADDAPFEVIRQAASKRSLHRVRSQESLKVCSSLRREGCIRGFRTRGARRCLNCRVLASRPVRFLSADRRSNDGKLLMALDGDEQMVSLIFATWNQLDGWLRQADGVRHAV